MENCPFCEELKKWKEATASYSDLRRNPEDYAEEYGVSLVNRSYFRGEHSGTMTGVFHKMNFCPVCGRKWGG